MKEIMTKRRIFCIAVVLAVIIVPFLYSYFYLGAFWDPYSKLEKLPVAVVNEDKGAKVNGANRNLGQEMCDKLEQDGTLKFVFTNKEDAESGTEGDDYYAAITIPGDFSENVASAATDNKQTASIIYSPNEKRNYLASQILNRAVLQIEEEIRSNVNKEIVQQLADNVKEMPGRLNTLQDGLSQLGAGSGKLTDGTGALASGARTLLDGTVSLSDGTNSLLNGTKTLTDGTNKLQQGSQKLASGTKEYYSKMEEYKNGVAAAQDGSAKLVTGAETLQSGINQLQSGTGQLVEKTRSISQITSGAQNLAEGTQTFNRSLTQYTAGVDSLISTVNDTSTFLTQYVKANPGLMQDAAFATFISKLSDPANAANIQTLQAAGTQIKAGSEQLVQGAGQLSEGTKNLPELNTALQSLSAGVLQLKDGSETLTDGTKSLDSGVASLGSATDSLYSAAGDIAGGAEELNSGVGSLNGGAKDLYSGADKLNSGAAALKSGTADLNSGAESLNNGAGELNNGIAAAKSGVDTAITDADKQIKKLDGLADYAKAPVSIEQENVTSISNYGTAFAPYFMSLSLWVGALILFVGIYLDTEGRFKIMSRDSSHKVARSFLFLFIGFLQAIALAAVVQFGLGLEIDNVPLYYISICLVSMVFISMVQFFMVHLKSVGKLVSIVMLILQLTSCGGTFPMEIVPKLFNVLYPYMPMTYSVALFKQAITSTDGKAVAYNMSVLFIILIVFMSLTIGLSRLKSMKESKATAQATA